MWKSLLTNTSIHLLALSYLCRVYTETRLVAMGYIGQGLHNQNTLDAILYEPVRFFHTE